MQNEIKGTLAGMFPFWSKLPPHDRELLEQGTITRKHKKGENIHGGGLDCTGIIGVVSGRLRVYLLSEEGKEVTLFRLLENDICVLSASCIIKNIEFDVYVDAEIDTSIILINSGTYENLGRKNPFAEAYIQEMVSMRFSEAMWVMSQVLFMKMDKRLAIFLLEQSNIEESDSIKLTHQEIADHMSTAREVVSRMLK
ncbi:MAG: Crp/Fnr family transcriptional regulator, partial [Peptostreptococcaceae bacterium]|nr:Crp/Fnr family transcriptional regulator [Peptostreptococcaceae bacterium]